MPLLPRRVDEEDGGVAQTGALGHHGQPSHADHEAEHRRQDEQRVREHARTTTGRRRRGQAVDGLLQHVVLYFSHWFCVGRGGACEPGAAVTLRRPQMDAAEGARSKLAAVGQRRRTGCGSTTLWSWWLSSLAGLQRRLPPL